MIRLLVSCCRFCIFFFFKQKTAYEMRISDWSSDVCSSDLCSRSAHARTDAPGRLKQRNRGDKTMKTINLPAVFDRMVAIELAPEIADALGGGPGVTIAAGDVRQIGQCGVQLLLSAALTASRRGLAFVIQDASEAFENAVRISGLRNHLSGRSAEHASEL